MDPRAVTPRRFASLAALAAAALGIAVAGCGDTAGYVDSGNRTAGKELFVARCGGCHTLADAGTKGQVGPDLDVAFRRALQDGMTDETVAQVVRGQISYPVVAPTTGAPGMPPIDETLPECDESGQPDGCVEDQDQAADDIAMYVASVAGREVPAGGGGGATGGSGASGGSGATGGSGAADGAQIFATAGCASCHTLAAAGSTGTVGPNLDEAKPPKDLVVERVTNGMGAMPPFKGQLTDAQIQAVADYVSNSAGG